MELAPKSLLVQLHQTLVTKSYNWFLREILCSPFLRIVYMRGIRPLYESQTEGVVRNAKWVED